MPVSYVPIGAAIATAVVVGVSCRLDLGYLDTCTSNCGDAGGADGPNSDGPVPVRSYRDEVMADSPALYLRFGESRGPTAVDETGHYDGAYSDGGVTYDAAGALAGDTNAAVAFDGSGVVLMPPGLDFSGTSPFTIELWADQTQPTSGYTIDHNDHARTRDGWDLYRNADAVAIERFDNGTTAGSAVTSVPGGLPLGTYHHVVATYDGSELRLYIDADLGRGGFTGAALSMATTGIAWTIGQASNCPCGVPGFIGSLDEVAVYTKALGQDRVAAHYHAAGR
jgi:hypothetical protein